MSPLNVGAGSRPSELPDGVVIGNGRPSAEPTFDRGVGSRRWTSAPVIQAKMNWGRCSKGVRARALLTKFEVTHGLPKRRLTDQPCTFA